MDAHSRAAATDIQQMKNDVHDMRTELRNVVEMLKGLVKAQEDMKQELTATKKELTVTKKELKADVAKLSHEVHSAIGNVVETTIRAEIRRLHGESYARRFVVNSLYGLARLCVPKRHNKEKDNNKDNAAIHEDYCDRLLGRILTDERDQVRFDCALLVPPLVHFDPLTTFVSQLPIHRAARYLCDYAHAVVDAAFANVAVSRPASPPGSGDADSKSDSSGDNSPTLNAPVSPPPPFHAKWIEVTQHIDDAIATLQKHGRMGATKTAANISNAMNTLASQLGPSAPSPSPLPSPQSTAPSPTPLPSPSPQSNTTDPSPISVLRDVQKEFKRLSKLITPADVDPLDAAMHGAMGKLRAALERARSIPGVSGHHWNRIDLCHRLAGLFSDYFSTKGEANRIELLKSCSGLGLFIFTFVAFCMPKGQTSASPMASSCIISPVLPELDFDCRGIAENTPTGLVIRIGEIKKDDDQLRKAYEQFVIRAWVLREASLLLDPASTKPLHIDATLFVHGKSVKSDTFISAKRSVPHRLWKQYHGPAYCRLHQRNEAAEFILFSKAIEEVWTFLFVDPAVVQ